MLPPPVAWENNAQTVNLCAALKAHFPVQFPSHPVGGSDARLQAGRRREKAQPIELPLITQPGS